MVLETDCKGISCKTVARYSWILYVKRKNKWIEVDNLNKMVSTDLSGPSVVLTGREYTLEQKTSYKMKVQAFLKDGSSESEYYEFITNEPPHHEDSMEGCSVNPTKGEAVVTEFKITCDGFMDVDQPISYDFSYHTTTGVVHFQSGLSSNASVRLPLGDPIANYSIIILVDVKDSYGATALAGLVDIRVSRTSKQVIDLILVKLLFI